MSIDDDLESINAGLNDLFKPKPFSNKPPQLIKHEEQKAPWHKKRIRRTQSDTYTMVCSYLHHEGDRPWIVTQLQTMPIQKREAAMMQYAKKYKSVYGTEPNVNKKDSTARKAANLWLVELIDKLA